MQLHDLEIKFNISNLQNAKSKWLKILLSLILEKISYFVTHAHLTFNIWQEINFLDT